MGKRFDPVDKLVGQNIRIFRVAKKLSQTQLGDALGVTFQQVQKYEKGVNRVGSGRLAKLSKILDVPINRFFDNGIVSADGPVRSEIVTDLLSEMHAVRMLKAFAKISNNKTRLKLVALTEGIAERPH